MSKLLKKLHKPCDQIDKYDNEPYMKNPLLKLKLADIRKYRRQNQVEQNAVKVINNLSLHPLLNNHFRLCLEQDPVVSKNSR